jgi:nucleotide-binding universal stress UspA family protein
MKRILLAYDGSKSAEKALRKAVDIARKFDSELNVISVAPELYLTDLLEVDRKRIRDSIKNETENIMRKIKVGSRGIKPIKTMIKQGDAAEEILRASGRLKADLIITGSHGTRGAKKFLIGSVSSKIVDHALCSVLVVK